MRIRLTHPTPRSRYRAGASGHTDHLGAIVPVKSTGYALCGLRDLLECGEACLGRGGFFAGWIETDHIFV